MKLSTHSQFDDDRYWRFQRTSNLPYGYFDRYRISPDVVVVAVAVICLIVALVVTFKEST